MKVAYFDCAAGASGDMMLGALVSAGAPRAHLERALRGFGLPGLRLKAETVRRGSFAGLLVSPVFRGKSPHNLLRTVMAHKTVRGIPSRVLSRGRSVIARLMGAEAKVHGRPAGHVHLHELEDFDTVADVYGTLLALDMLGIGMVYSSTLALGAGKIRAAHGLMPVPAPGTAELLRGRRVAFGPRGSGELVTPTAAAILAEIAGPGPVPPFTIDRIGVGAGMRNPPGMANLLRLFVGEALFAAPTERVFHLEAEVDDMNPQLAEAWLDRAYREGALEAWTHPVHMKKRRTGLALVALVRAGSVEAVSRAFLEETATLGVRLTPCDRFALERQERVVRTGFGPVRVKLAGQGASFHAVPEYRDMKELARKAGIPLRIVEMAVKRRLPGK